VLLDKLKSVVGRQASVTFWNVNDGSHFNPSEIRTQVYAFRNPHLPLYLLYFHQLLKLTYNSQLIYSVLK
jgi:hypothetical protein